MRTIAQPAAWGHQLPDASPPAGMAIHHLPTGTYETRAVFAVSGGSFRDKRQFASSAILVTHPQGDLLIDAGFGADVEEHIAMLPRMVRAPHQVGRTVSDQLNSTAYDRSRLIGVLPTHSHWDHVSGLDGLRDVPVWMNDGERKYAETDPDGRVFRKIATGNTIQSYDFQSGPYLGFSRSHDVYGDGSVVIALAGGHTTGSVIAFVTLPSGQRYAFIGDLTWQMDGIRRRVERPWLLSKMADSDQDELRLSLSKMIALDARMQIVPAHDLAAYDGIPLLLPETEQR